MEDCSLKQQCKSCDSDADIKNITILSGDKTVLSSANLSEAVDEAVSMQRPSCQHLNLFTFTWELKEQSALVFESVTSSLKTN